jgi:hypothetical protein
MIIYKIIFHNVEIPNLYYLKDKLVVFLATAICNENERHAMVLSVGIMRKESKKENKKSKLTLQIPQATVHSEDVKK